MIQKHLIFDLKLPEKPLVCSVILSRNLKRSFSQFLRIEHAQRARINFIPIYRSMKKLRLVRGKVSLTHIFLKLALYCISWSPICW